MKTVYLAGLISTEKPESLHWRIEAEEHLREHAVVLSPMRGKENLVKTSKDGGITDPSLTKTDVTIRDYHDIRKADVILAHLESFGSTRPLIGTIAELAWAWDHKIPVVAVAREGNILMRTHPFINTFVSHYVEHIDEGVDILVRHWLR